MAIEGKLYGEIAEFLDIDKSFVSCWKQEFYEQGIEGLRLGDHGRKKLPISRRKTGNSRNDSGPTARIGWFQYATLFTYNAAIPR